MARVFTGSQSLSQASAVVSAVPLTLACWVNLSNATGDQTAIEIADATGSNAFVIQILSGIPKAITVAASVAGAASSSVSLTTNTWYHLCAVFASASLRTIYVNGVSRGTDATALTPSGLSDTYIGVRPAGHFLTATLAQPGIWSVALSQSDVTNLAVNYYHPSMVQHAVLQAYPPLFT